ncbi:hypothetical protein HanOQP8_Chr03g0107101 [Helianthus annuus]|nr:hypothetical protein HanOQP8_Chr03g0107101 [Helianthus annuus]
MSPRFFSDIHRMLVIIRSSTNPNCGFHIEFMLPDAILAFDENVQLVYIFQLRITV